MGPLISLVLVVEVLLCLLVFFYCVFKDYSLRLFIVDVKEVYHQILVLFFSHCRAHRNGSQFYHGGWTASCFLDRFEALQCKRAVLCCYAHRLIIPKAPGVYFYESSAGEKLTHVHYNTRGQEDSLQAIIDSISVRRDCIPVRKGESAHMSAERVKVVVEDDYLIVYKMVVFRVMKPVEPIYRAFILVGITLPDHKISFAHPHFRFIVNIEGEAEWDSSVPHIFGQVTER